ncbi:hypothetical protein MY04_5327 [Flammeovirga sp. MY04]|uniref:lipase family protein n=1 Tax=Flammeovirga sp. MY04 TaxID=1191459 RepID=UPI0008060FAE|nr:hypothetical protein [Flammeovirga sp. MY04]ANQ52659.1 hypothetical protein MY04_5327 [Flammeovirga sp. MY04]
MNNNPIVYKYYSKGIECIINYDDGILNIEFHPTNKVYYWLIKRLNTQKKNGIHSGYLKSFLLISKNLWKEQNNLLIAAEQVNVIGFGVGGAIAKLFCLEYFRRYHQTSSIVTYDSPIPFDDAKLEEFNNSVHHQRHYIFGLNLVNNFRWRLIKQMFTPKLKLKRNQM